MLTSVEHQASDLAHDIVLGKRVKDHANKAKEHWQLLSKQTNHIGNRPNMELLWTYRYHVSNLKHSSLEKSAVRQNKVYKNVEKKMLIIDQILLLVNIFPSAKIRLLMKF